MAQKQIISLNTAIQCTAESVPYESENVAYGWGNVDALMKWINAKNHKAVEKALGIGQNSRKYPLIWLVEGWQGNVSPIGLTFTNVTFHIAVNSNVESLNENRIPQFDILYQVANDFMGKLRLQGVKITSNVERWSERANFSVTQRGDGDSHTIDIWDTLILQTELIINPHCLSRLCGS